jgi:tyrosyl-tRNA synthetase
LALRGHLYQRDFLQFADLEAAFAAEKIHPGDLKAAVEKYLNRLLDPVR